MGVDDSVGDELESFLGTGEGVASQVEHAIHHIEIHGPLSARYGD